MDVKPGAELVSTAEHKRDGNLAGSSELCTGSSDETLERKIFQLALALDFSTWALGRIDERVMSMALEYAHDAEVLVQLLSFKGGTFASLRQDMEDLYQQEKISEPVYVRTKLLLRAYGPPQQK
jgi:hypothetical protein